VPTTAERRALIFTATIALLGVGARFQRARDARPAPPAASLAALDAQIARVDSARQAARQPSRGRGRTATPVGKRGANASGSQVTLPPVDLDTADRAAIEALPWIGPSLAARIMESRQRCGPFGSLEGLTRVNGIGAATSRRLAPYVTFSGRSRPTSAEAGTGCPAAAEGAASRKRGRS